jgi:hypothetical protein
MEFMSLEHSLEKKFERERALVQEQAAAQLQKELAHRTEALHRQLSELEEAVVHQMEELEQRVQQEQQAYAAELEQNHPKIKESWARVQELERQLKAVKEEAERERAKDFESFEKEKQRLTIEHERALSLLKEQQTQEHGASAEFSNPSREESKGVFSKLVDYLNGPVIDLGSEKDRTDGR